MSALAPAGVGVRRVWDLPVRVFHWTLVLAVAGAWLTHKLGVSYFIYHVWCGYTVLVLVVFRVVWGFVGTRHARFRNFLRHPLVTVRYGWDLLIGRAGHFVGHNPLGAWMVILLLLALLTQSVVGLFGDDEIFNLGPLNGYVSHARGIELTSLHRKLFYWIVGAIGLHVVAVVLHRLVRGEDLVRAMFTGRKPATAVPAGEAIQSSRIGVALLIIAVLAVALAWVVRHAPVPQGSGAFD
jgi:cytochrome b